MLDLPDWVDLYKEKGTLDPRWFGRFSGRLPVVQYSIDLKMAENQRWLTVGYRAAFQSQLSPSLAADLWWDPQFGKNSWARGLEMMREAGIDGFASLKKDADFAAVSVVLDPLQLNKIQWNNGVAKGSDGNSAVTFALPESQYVNAIRVAFRYQNGKPGNLRVVYRRTQDKDYLHPITTNMGLLFG